MISIVATYIVFGILILCTILAFVGSTLRYILPVAIRLRNHERTLSNLNFSKSLIENEQEAIFTLCDKKLKQTHLSPSTDVNALRDYIDKYSITELLQIVHIHRQQRIIKLLKKLRVPSFVLLVMAAASYLSIIGTPHTDPAKLFDIWNQNGFELFKVLSISELVTFLLIIIPLVVELYQIDDLLDAMN